MQGYNWNDLKLVLALSRSGRLVGASRIVAVNETTVARRIKALEKQLGAALFVRALDGRYEVTAIGQQVVAQAESIEAQHLDIAATTGAVRANLSGIVRVSALPFLVNHVLVAHFAPFARKHPDLTVELVPEARNADLTKREADLALRLARPSAGGLRVKARKLEDLKFGLYGGVSEPEHAKISWITYDGTHASLPQAQWLASRAGKDGSPLRVADLTTAQEAAAAGLGRTALPVICAAGDARLRRLDVGDAPPPDRPLWLLSHADQTRNASVAAVRDWIAGLDWQGSAVSDP